MLQKLNERIQGFIAWIVIVLIAITFTLFGVDYYMQSHQASDAAVEVNDQVISRQVFEASYRRARQQRDPSQMTAATDLALKKQVLNDLITNQVSLQAARRVGFEISPSQANAAILNIPQFQQDGHFSPERYQQALNGAMFTPESFQNEVRQGMLLNQQRFAFIGSSFALPEEIKRFVKLYMQTRNYDYLKIPVQNFTKNIQISDEEINKYYQENRKKFIAPEQLSIDYVRLSTAQIKNKISISPEQIKQYYEENKSSFFRPAKWRVAHILFAIPNEATEEQKQQTKQNAVNAYHTIQTNPKQFNELLKKSDDKLSIANGGLLPWIVAGESGFDKSLADLKKPGEITEPFETTKGYEIFKLIDYKASVLKPLNEVQLQIKEQLLADLTQTQYAQALEKLSDLSYQNPDSLTAVAQALDLPIEKTSLFSRKGGTTDLTKSKLIINASFSHDVLELGNNSEPIQLDNDSVVVLRVNNHIPAKEKPLAEVKDQIVTRLVSKEATEKAKQLGLAILSSDKDQSKQKNLIQANQLQWQQVENAKRENDKVDPTINEFAFSLPRANSLDGKSLSNGDYVLIRLQKINDGQLETLNKEQQASLEQQIETSFGVMDYDLYVNNLISKAKIVKH